VKVTVLGRYSPYPPRGGACPGYWVEAEEGGSASGILLDCGPGSLRRFQEHVGPLSKIHTVILSHLHFDHISDVMALRYAAGSDRRHDELPDAVRIYAPPEPEKEFSLLPYKKAVTAHAVSEGMALKAGPFNVTFYPTAHPILSFAVRVEGPGGVLVYSGDTRPCDGIIQAAKGADLFLCEASGVEADADYIAPGHLTARQAGEVAAEAGVKRLLLTHIWPLCDEEQLLMECRKPFPGAEVAQEGRTYTV